jgi:hypothetical protein
LRRKLFPILLVLPISLFLSCLPGGTEFITQPHEYSCISLRNLSAYVKASVDGGRGIPGSVKALQGFSRIDGYCINPVDSDVILFGKCDRSRPAYDIYDLVICYQCIYGQQVFPYCSLDPQPENIKRCNRLRLQPDATEGAVKKAFADAMGDQKVVIGGVPRNSRIAATMIEADYYMKKLSLGIARIQGIKSYLDYVMQGAKGRQAQSTANHVRFWFHIRNADSVCYPRYDYSSGIVRIRECPVVVLSEQQVADRNGVLADTRERDPAADTFAHEMSASFPRLVEKVRSFAMLENYYRLAAVVTAIRTRTAAARPYESLYSSVENAGALPGRPLPDYLPCVANAKSFWKWMPAAYGGSQLMTSMYGVCGGVDMGITIASANYSQSPRLATYRNGMLSQKPVASAMFWKAAFPGGIL